MVPVSQTNQPDADLAVSSSLTFVCSRLSVNSFEEDAGTTSSDSDGEILKQFEISVSRSHTLNTQSPDRRRERPRLGPGPSINRGQETDGEGGPSAPTPYQKGSIF